MRVCVRVCVCVCVCVCELELFYIIDTTYIIIHHILSINVVYITIATFFVNVILLIFIL